MSKIRLTIDTESINLENEIHINSFSNKIKNLARHCINFINSIEDKTDCCKIKFLPEFHDNYESKKEFFPSLIKTNIDSNYSLHNNEYSSVRLE